MNISYRFIFLKNKLFIKIINIFGRFFFSFLLVFEEGDKPIRISGNLMFYN